jgi:hypothetical protein
MVKVEDATVLTPEQINTAECPICGESIKWGGDHRSYTALHCDRTLSVEPQFYKVSVRKLTPENINNAIEANTEEDESSETSVEETEDKDSKGKGKLSDEEEEDPSIDDEAEKKSSTFSGFTYKNKFNTS